MDCLCIFGAGHAIEKWHQDFSSIPWIYSIESGASSELDKIGTLGEDNFRPEKGIVIKGPYMKSILVWPMDLNLLTARSKL